MGERDAEFYHPYFYPWPPPTDTLFYELVTKQGDGSLTLMALATGSMYFCERRNGQITVEFTSQIIATRLSGGIEIRVVLDDPSPHLLLDGQRVKSLQEAGEDVVIFELRPYGAEPVPSFRRLDARSACAKLMLGRAKAYGSRTPPKGRRELSVHELLIFLGKAIRNVREYLASLGDGSTDKLGPLACELRALILRNDENLALLPLLAYKLDLPLPVFSFPKRKDTPGDTVDVEDRKTLIRHTVVDPCSVWRMFPGQRLTDLESYLRKPADIERRSRSGEGQERTARVEDIIRAVAYTMGSAHYSSHAHPDADALIALGGGVLVNIIKFAGYVTADLGEYVINEARRRKAT